MPITSRRMLMTTVSSGDELKTSWPEVVGMGIFGAAARIHNDRPDVRMEFPRVGHTVDPGYDDKRVRIYAKDDAPYIVAQTPVVG